MRIVRGTLRGEMQITSLEENIKEDDVIRVIDAIVESLDLEKLGLKEKERKSEAGRPKYSEKTMLKLYLFGYQNGIRSGQKLENACKYDLRMQWLLEKQTPDKNTINDFRKNNIELIKNVFYETNRMYADMNILKIKEISQDGFKVKAKNSKENNYTINKVTERIKREEKEIKEINEYLNSLEKNEELEELEERIEEKKKELEKIEARCNKHKGILTTLKEEGISQVSLIDEESRLMPNNGKFEVCYNNQTAVDTETHLTIAIQTDNNPADIGSMSNLMEEIKKEYKTEEVIINTTDKGYNSTIDMIECLEMGVIPQVTPNKKGQEEIELSTIYEENKITEEIRKSKREEDIKKCIRAGVIPECYEGKIKEIKVEEVQEVEEEKEEIKETRSAEEIREEAITKQTFERDIRTNLVYCPMGEILGQKNKIAGGYKKYCNKLVCKRCKNPCTKCKYKEVIFKDGQKRVVPKNSAAIKPRNKIKKKISKKKVYIKLKIDREILKKRMATSEHSQGTMKTTDHCASFSVRGREKAEGELALYFTASNIRRVKNMVGSKELMRMIKEERKSNEVGIKQSKIYGINEILTIIFRKLAQ